MAMDAAQKVHDLVMWVDVKASGLALAIGLTFFFLVGAWGWSSLGVVCMCLTGHLAVRFAYYNTVGVRPDVPAEWLSEQEIQEHLKSITARANAIARTAFALTTSADNQLTVQWMGGLGLVALMCRLIGTTGLCFLIFVAAFSLPKVFELKKKEIEAGVQMVQVKALEASTAARKAVGSITKGAAPKSDEAEKKKL